MWRTWSSSTQPAIWTCCAGLNTFRQGGQCWVGVHLNVRFLKHPDVLTNMNAWGDLLLHLGGCFLLWASTHSSRAASNCRDEFTSGNKSKKSSYVVFYISTQISLFCASFAFQNRHDPGPWTPSHPETQEDSEDTLCLPTSTVSQVQTQKALCAKTFAYSICIDLHYVTFHLFPDPLTYHKCTVLTYLCGWTIFFCDCVADKKPI